MKRKFVNIILTLLLSISSVFGLGATIAWNPVIEDINNNLITEPISYNLYIGTNSLEYYTYVDSSSNSIALDGFEYNKDYYFAATAKTLHYESEFSLELHWKTPTTLDNDSDGISDFWELFYFDSLDLIDSNSDYDGDGISDYIEYVAGYDPTDKKDFPSINVYIEHKKAYVSFETRKINTILYENRKRYISVEICTDLLLQDWEEIDYIEADGTIKSYQLGNTRGGKDTYFARLTYDLK